MALTAGERLGPYEVLAPLGAGGMGEVYRARDTKLKRDVALKVLPEAVASDLERMARFEREAQVLASLNHPNIAAIYGVEGRAIVMEMVEGDSPRGPMPFDDAWKIASQIAAALDYAHERGIVHRDLKPANVKITPDGVVKLLDFGLAKAFTGQTVASSGIENSPTLTLGATQMGVILGTAAYMAPEQAKGRAVDKRADVWAFGVVLYELLTGERLFTGDDVSEVLAAVIKEEPSLDRVPAPARRLLKSCLEKDPKRRLRDIADAWRQLEEPAKAPADAVVAAARQKRVWPWQAAAAAFAVAGIAVALLHFREPAPPAELARFEIQPPPKSSFQASPRVSPDGRRIAFTGPGPNGSGSIVWVRSIDSLEARPLPDTEAAFTGNLFWSPDSRFIAFGGASKLKKVNVAGGPSQTICEFAGNYRGGAWNQDGVILFGTAAPGGIWRVPSAGGTATLLLKPDSSRQEVTLAGPVFLPDQRHFLYFRGAAAPEKTGIYIGSLDAPNDPVPAKPPIPTGSNPVYAPSADPRTGYILFLRESTLMAQALDQRNLELIGEVVPIAEGVGTIGNQGFFSASATGTLAFLGGSFTGNRQYTWFDRAGKNLEAPLEPGLYGELSVSPDGTRVAGERQPVGGTPSDVWLLDLATKISTRFTFDPAIDRDAVFSPDGSRVAFDSNRENGWSIYVKPANSAGSEQLLYRSGEEKRALAWSRDGKHLLYSSVDPKTGPDLMALPLDAKGAVAGKPIPVVRTEFSEGEGQFSPDSRWIAYRSNESGRNEIYVQPFPPVTGGGKWMVSKNGGTQPRWRHDGKELLYIAPDGTLMSVDVSTQPVFRSGIPRPLFDTRIYGGGGVVAGAARWDIAPDGKRFLVLTQVGADISAPMTVVLNWPALLASGEAHR